MIRGGSLVPRVGPIRLLCVSACFVIALALGISSGTRDAAGAFTQQEGTIRIAKNTTGGGPQATFDFGPLPEGLDCGGQSTLTTAGPQVELTCTALAGSYPVTEADPGPAFALSQLDCNDDNSARPSTTDLATRTATYELEVGEEVFCLFTNRFQGGTIRIAKNTTGGGPQATFDFGPLPEGLDCGGQSTLTTAGPQVELTCTALAGSYPVTEADPGPAFALSQLDCNDDNSARPSTTDLATRTATYELEVGEEVFCLFTNRFQGGTIRIAKNTTGGGPQATFDFGPLPEGLDCGGQSTLTTAGPQVELTCTALAGSYPVTEADPGPAFALSQLDCNDDNSARPSTTDLATRTATYELEVGEEVFCLFTNRFQGGTIRIAKNTTGGGPQATFDFGPLPEGLDCGGQSTLTTAGPQVELTCTALAGSYPVTEADPGPAFALSQLDCNDDNSARPSTTDLATRTATYELEVGEEVFCLFTNRFQGGTIRIAKNTTGGGPQATFDFGPLPEGLDCGGQSTLTTAGPQVELTCTALAGSYPVTEADPGPAFALSQLDCNDDNSARPSTTDLATRTATYELEVGEEVFCLFTNRFQGGTIRIAKNTTGGGPQATFDFGPLPEGLDCGGQSTLTTAGPQVELTCTALAGSYPVTEADPGPAFALSQLDCNDDNSARPSTTDLATRTATYELEVGEEVFCLFTNRFQGGTIRIAKNTTGGGPQATFDFGPLPEGLDCGGQSTLTTAGPQVELTCTALAGSYPVTEADPGPAFALSQLDCNDDNSARPSTTDLATRTATYELEVGRRSSACSPTASRGARSSSRSELVPRAVLSRLPSPRATTRQASRSGTESPTPVGRWLRTRTP